MTARAGMSDLISKLRALTSSGTADYTVSSTVYWTDDQLQSVLDQHRTDFKRQMLEATPQADNSGNLHYYDYYLRNRRFLEGTASGTAAWLLANSAGGTVPYTDYTLNIDMLHLLFTADQGGTVYYLTAREYDVFAAASDVWEQKAADVWDRFDLKTDNHDMSRSQLYAHAKDMAKRMRARNGITTSLMERTDVWDYGG